MTTMTLTMQGHLELFSLNMHSFEHFGSPARQYQTIYWSCFAWIRCHGEHG